MSGEVKDLMQGNEKNYHALANTREGHSEINLMSGCSVLGPVGTEINFYFYHSHSDIISWERNFQTLIYPVNYMICLSGKLVNLDTYIRDRGVWINKLILYYIIKGFVHMGL